MPLSVFHFFRRTAVGNAAEVREVIKRLVGELRSGDARGAHEEIVDAAVEFLVPLRHQGLDLFSL